jgi:hypothetical protein
LEAKKKYSARLNQDTPRTSRATPNSLLCGLRDLCAMLSPASRLSRTEPSMFANGPSVILPNFLLCDLRDLCAMLSSIRVFLVPNHRGLLSVIENCIAGE